MASDLEITIHSARDLKNVNWKHGELCAYAKVWLDSDDQINASTRVDPSGDTDPSWEQKLTLPVNKAQLQDASLVVAIYHERPENPEKPQKAKVGTVSIPLMEIVDAGGYEETLDYSLTLKRPSGRPQGKIKFSARLRERRYQAPPPSSYNSPPYGAVDAGSRDYQPFPYQGYSPAQPYGQPSYPYPQPAPAYGYGQQPTPPYYAYGQSQPPPVNYGQQPPPPSDYYQDPPQKQGSRFGGFGTGLAVGALAGGVGALALNEYVEHEENEAAEEQALEDAQRFNSAQDEYYYEGDDF